MKFTETILVLVLLFSVAILFAQPCDLDGRGIRITTQNGVDIFSSQYPDCDVIQGDLLIAYPIENLRGLSQIRRIEGSLFLRDASWINRRNQNLSSLEGLNNLEYVGGNLYIDSIENLITLEGLSSLEVVKGDVYLANNQSLEYLDGMSKLDSIIGKLTIRGHPSLRNLVHLNTINHMLGDIEVSSNALINNLSGFENLRRVNGNMVIRSNASLDSLKGLERLEAIDQDLVITDNPDLGIMGRLVNNYEMGPVNLISIGEELKIINNDALQTMSGLNGLKRVGDRFDIKNNESLHDLSNLQSLNELNGILAIDNNPSLLNLNGFNNLNEIGGLGIGNNSSLFSLYGIHNIRIVHGDFGIGGQQPGLEIISGGELPDGSGAHRFLEVDSILGSLYISGYAHSLLGFYQLDYIGGDLSFTRNIKLSGFFSPFTNLKRIDGVLSFDYNYELSEIHFPNLQYIGGVNFSNNDKLSVCQFNNLKTIGEQGMRIRGNNLLSSFAYSVPVLEEILGDVELYDTEVRDFTGFENLKLIDGHFTFDLNWNLFSLNGLNNLEYINGNLIMNNSRSLIGMNMHELQAINGVLNISGNRYITALNGLENIDPQSISELSIGGNQSLSVCAIKSICDYLASNRPVTIQGNAEGCNTVDEVQDACAFLHTNEQGFMEFYLTNNPVSDFLQISGHLNGADVKASIFNAFGERVFEKDRIREGERILMAGLPAGSYILQLNNGTTVQAIKFVKH